MTATRLIQLVDIAVLTVFDGDVYIKKKNLKKLYTPTSSTCTKGLINTNLSCFL